jgi:hypothetical protein
MIVLPDGSIWTADEKSTVLCSSPMSPQDLNCARACACVFAHLRACSAPPDLRHACADYATAFSFLQPRNRAFSLLSLLALPVDGRVPRRALLEVTRDISDAVVDPLVRALLYDSPADFRDLYHDQGGSLFVEDHLLLLHSPDLDVDHWRDELFSLCRTRHATALDRAFADSVADVRATNAFVELAATVYTQLSDPTPAEVGQLASDFDAGAADWTALCLQMAKGDFSAVFAELAGASNDIPSLLFALHMMDVIARSPSGALSEGARACAMASVLRLCDHLVRSSEMRRYIRVYLRSEFVDQEVAEHLFQRLKPLIEKSEDEELDVGPEFPVPEWEDTATVERLFPLPTPIRERLVNGDANGPRFAERDLESRKDLLREWAASRRDELLEAVGDVDADAIASVFDAAVAVDLTDVSDLLEARMFEAIEESGTIPYAEDWK